MRIYTHTYKWLQSKDKGLKIKSISATDSQNTSQDFSYFLNCLKPIFPSVLGGREEQEKVTSLFLWRTHTNGNSFKGSLRLQKL